MQAPKPGKADLAHAAVGGVIGMVPVAGSLAQAAYQQFLAPPFQRKVQAFLADVESKLIEHGTRIEELADDDRFHDAAVHAALIAGRTRDAGKRDALRNAVVNVALQSEDEAHESLFLAWIDALTPAHVAVVALLDDPSPRYSGQRPPMTIASLGAMIEANTGLGRPLYEAVVSDLDARGLTAGVGPALQTRVTGSGLLARRTTDVGHRFVQFLRMRPVPAPP